ncbi:MAG: hypothetical protein KGL93_13355 [Gemmatimonadota bacterium]|nr:hypothetical protein [Gemmatimonadota bacterium]
MTGGPPVEPTPTHVPPHAAPPGGALAAAARAHRRRLYKPLYPKPVYYRHLLRNGLIGASMVFAALMVGVLGYHFTAGLGWLDALVNASMILGGMGPVDPVRSDVGKWFESFYALFSGVVFISSVGVLLAPAARRFLHRMHLDIEAED